MRRAVGVSLRWRPLDTKTGPVGLGSRTQTVGADCIGDGGGTQSAGSREDRPDEPIGHRLTRVKAVHLTIDLVKTG